MKSSSSLFIMNGDKYEEISLGKAVDMLVSANQSLQSHYNEVKNNIDCYIKQQILYRELDAETVHILNHILLLLQFEKEIEEDD